MREPNPCHGCTERYTACHDHCKRHKKWKAKHQAEQKYLDDNAYRFSTLWSASREKTLRTHSKFGADGFKRGGAQ